MQKIKSTSVFKGIIKDAHNNNYPTIVLVQDNGWKVDLIDRIGEVLINRTQSYVDYRLSIFVSSSPQKFESVDGNWAEVIESHYLRCGKSSYDVEYFSDWHDTKYKSEFEMKDRDIKRLLLSFVDRWVYLKLDLLEPKKR